MPVPRAVNRDRMARLLGPLFIFRFLTRTLTVSQIERRALSILSCSGVSIRGCAPELAFDIDHPVDYRYAVQHQAWAGPSFAFDGLGPS